MKILPLIIALTSLSSFAATSAQRLYYPSNMKLGLINPTDSDVKGAIAQFAATAGLTINTDQLQLKEIQESILASHYRFSQVLDGHAVAEAEIVVSINAQGEVIKIYNTLLNAPQSKMRSLSSPLLSSEQAISAAFTELKVDGNLLAEPKAQLVYTNDQDVKLVYDLDISVSSPFGHWNVRVDAMNGKVLSVQNGALERIKRTPVDYKNRAVKSLVSVKQALKAFRLAHVATRAFDQTILANGTASIFDPNPVVSLGRIDLTDTTNASVFLPAYKTVELKDLSLVNGIYSLKGAKVSIIDFEAPSTAPSTSSNGVWSKQRGNNAFNDVMTYFHIDQSIRYLESIGFTGAKAVFKSSVEVDSDGVSGADNSHYIPAQKRLAFGHGCVDDNEDSDVILHELGHAIHHHINSSWKGGDTGAMGEGFGDYWAASYSTITQGGQNTAIHPEWVFKWDGHNSCWPGRKLNALTMVYNPSSTYQAHANVSGGISDELWSTPLFQAFQELRAAGVERADIDKIIIESHFGLGSGIKMRDMANAIVKTAKALFPAKGYDQIYYKAFKRHSIVL
ncbi:MAG: hypothetical protein ACOYL6_12175 [Bacteriovoracaceae bacterium]